MGACDTHARAITDFNLNTLTADTVLATVLLADAAILLAALLAVAVLNNRSLALAVRLLLIADAPDLIFNLCAVAVTLADDNVAAAWA